MTYSTQLEWILAAVWANYKPFDEFFDLDGWKQSVVIGAYRTNNRIEGVIANEQMKQMKRKNARARKGGSRAYG